MLINKLKQSKLEYLNKKNLSWFLQIYFNRILENETIILFSKFLNYLAIKKSLFYLNICKFESFNKLSYNETILLRDVLC